MPFVVFDAVNAAMRRPAAGAAWELRSDGLRATCKQRARSLRGGVSRGCK